MTLISFLVFLVPILDDVFILHALWPERTSIALLLKFSLGIGVGLGSNSILYFLSLIFRLGTVNIFFVEIGLCVVLALITFWRERKARWNPPDFSKLARWQWGLLILSLITFSILALVFISLTLSQPQGGVDAWSIWNRAARFISRDPGNWRAAISPQLYWHDHADYPLLVPLNVAWGWRVIGNESMRIPMMQGAFFVLGALGVMFAGMALTRTIGQASLALLVLMGTPLFVWSGAGLVADLPITYYIFSSSFLLLFALTQRNNVFWALSGFMAGLAGWTKNEGLLYIAACSVILIVIGRKDRFRSLLYFAAGLAIPLSVILYFKSIAPPSDLFTGAGAFVQLLDFSRYWIILGAIGRQFLVFGFWPFSIFIGLFVYAILMQMNWPAHLKLGIQALSAIILLQFLGYILIYLLTPHDLIWQLDTSLYRLVLQLYPTCLFLFFSVVSEPERVFRSSQK